MFSRLFTRITENTQWRTMSLLSKTSFVGIRFKQSLYPNTFVLTVQIPNIYKKLH
ncbi:hypothetical protein HanXRQr2_Chr01g0032531 [Helianthus annuus]|uniref:Uncharacterized protein n=1 Tax=Helianthus annuus TaxID=4232 RepID=A0A9K3P4A0_HELAN|nr:hypothetical protein HanXRQr2_Chr01g0032531 [Helianthus annuus]KAJ0623765.1 hypothetical protein HanIR_Chr01g0035821 [Helianthus annuus]KAJ0957789.1 hypothetical protein HanPSC8_Chr01g0031721 [Helianthus annuus]